MQCLPFHNDEQSDSGHNHTSDADAELGSDGQGTKASLSTSTFANSHSRAPSISTQSCHKHTLHPPPRNEAAWRLSKLRQMHMNRGWLSLHQSNKITRWHR